MQTDCAVYVQIDCTEYCGSSQGHIYAEPGVAGCFEVTSTSRLQRRLNVWCCTWDGWFSALVSQQPEPQVCSCPSTLCEADAAVLCILPDFRPLLQEKVVGSWQAMPSEAPYPAMKLATLRHWQDVAGHQYMTEGLLAVLLQHSSSAGVP